MQRHLWTEMTTRRAIEAADTFLKTRVTSRKKNERYIWKTMDGLETETVTFRPVLEIAAKSVGFKIEDK